MVSRTSGLRGRTLSTTPLRAIVVLAALAVAVSSATIALGAVGDTGIVTTCFSKATATWRPIDTASGQKCKSGEQQLNFYTKERVDSLLGSLNFLTQAAADAAYLGKTAKAADSDKLDGLDSTAFLPFTNCIGYPHFGIDWHSCDLTHANLSGAGLDYANLYGASLVLANLSGADLTNTTLSGATLNGSTLNGANLRFATLNGADLSNADLTGADLSNADLTGANLSGANLSGASLSGVIWSNTICPDGTNSDDNGGTCLGHL